MKTNILTVTILSLILFCGATFAQESVKKKTDPALVKLGKNFTSNYAEVNGTTIHYMRGGKGATRMQEFTDLPDEKISSIKQPVLIIVGDQDFIRPEHAVEMFRAFQSSQLAVFPGGHGEYLGVVECGIKEGRTPQFVVAIVEEFLDSLMVEN